MPYIEENLITGEEIISKAKLHPYPMYFYGVLAVIGVVMLFSSRESAVVGLLLVPFGILMLIVHVITSKTTELAVTNKRVVAKTGLIARNTVELQHGKIESLEVKQGIMARIFGAGTIIIHGSGGVASPIKFISKPLEFRKSVYEAVEKSKT
ncbi:MAG: PH domain-containing protein [Magnetococcales bacterium]|nr:PH domain-containing protein [Magnetococcales bacterium]